MSFMSFDYAMRAADAALQMQQGMAQNIRDTNQRVAEVGKRNANSKDQLVRQKIQAEYDMQSANIKAWKAGRLHALAQERAQRAKAAAALVGIGHLAGGVFDGIKDLAEKQKNHGADVPQSPDSAQIMVPPSVVDNGYATAFRVSAGNGPSEEGAVVTFDPKRGTFGAFSINTTTGDVPRYSTMSATQMATLLRDSTRNSADPDAQRLHSMIAEGPPVMFKPEHFRQNEDGSFYMSEELRAALFGVQNPSSGVAQGGFFNSDMGESAIGGVLANGAQISPGQQATSRAIMGLLETPQLQQQLNLNPATVEKTRDSMKQSGLLKSGVGIGDVFTRAIFKPISTTLQNFMSMYQVAQQYEEEAKAKKVEYEEAKKHAANARKKLLELEAALAAGI